MQTDPQWIQVNMQMLALFAMGGSAFGVTMVLMIMMRKVHSHQRKVKQPKTNWRNQTPHA